MFKLMFIVLVIVGSLFMQCAVPAWRCESVGEAMRLPNRYGYIDGCLVQTGGRWVPLESVRTEVP